MRAYRPPTDLSRIRNIRGLPFGCRRPFFHERRPEVMPLKRVGERQTSREGLMRDKVKTKKKNASPQPRPKRKPKRVASARAASSAVASRAAISPKERRALMSAITAGAVRAFNPNIIINDSAGRRVPNSVTLADIP